ncbi:unnamed protein product [Trifolium pratense]|uniref:Uncharacterized protein n=1 Tax=Trifolium pratense TaxID=57577 RepID=A0ACB0LM72_TRIPR|nr:unnamed protein product [Trifolium pratense]
MDTNSLRHLICLAPIKDVTITILVDEVRNKVLFVQAGKDFIDGLLSFLTLPLGTIARLIGKDYKFGSISSLYESVTDLDEENFWSPLQKELLVRPVNSMERYCQHFKLNIDDTEKLRSFKCGDKECTRPKKRTCNCIKIMRDELCKVNFITKRGFVPKTATFTVSDDLNVKPDNSKSCISLPKYLGCGDINTIKIVTVEVTRKEILELVLSALLSSKPLTDVFLSNILEIQYAKRANVLDLRDDNIGARLVRNTIEVKATVRKYDNKILYVLGEEDFADLLLSFLTFPLGAVENLLNGNSGLDNIDNLFKSMVDLDPQRYFNCKADLLSKQVKYNFGGKNYIKNPSTYMVTDELVITPGSSISSFSFLSERKIRLSNLEERVISIGNREALCLLKASLISKSALTDGLGPFLANKDKKVSN